MIAARAPRASREASESRLFAGFSGASSASRYIGAAVALHALVLLAGARLASREQAGKPPVELAAAALAAAAREVFVDVARTRPEGEKGGAEGRSPGSAARPEEAESRSAARSSGRRGAPKLGGEGERVGERPRHEDAAPPHRAALPGELSGALEAWSRTFRTRASALASPPLSAAGEGEGADRTGEGPGASLKAAGAAGRGQGGGLTGVGKGSVRRGNSGWGESWDYVIGAHAGELAGPSSLRSAGNEADEATLPRRIVEGVVGQSVRRLRVCYDDGRRRDSSLAGRILVRFLVDLRGSVLVAADGGSTVADPAVIRCALTTFSAMTFPARPQGEAVWTTHLIAFPPGE